MKFPMHLFGVVAALCWLTPVNAGGLAPADIAAAVVAPVASPMTDKLADQIKDVFDLKSYTLQAIDVPQGVEGPFTIRVRLGEQMVDVALEPHSMRADGFQVLVDDGSGRLTRVEPPALCTMRGDVLNDPNSRVRASIIRGGLTAWIDLGDGAAWAIQQVAAEIPGVDPRLHVVYRDREIAPPPGYHCGVDDHAKPGAGIRPVGGEQGPAPRTTGDRIADIAFDADVEYYVSLGSSVPNVVNDIESLMNAIEAIYENNTDISYEVTTIVVRTAEPDPYTSTNPGTLLDQFTAHWSGTLGAIRRDLAHLMTGKNIDGGVIGIARLGTICSTSSGYGLSQSRYTGNITLRRSLTAHEIGHNWNAQHCDGSGTCNIMCSCNGCGPPDCTGNFTSFGAGEAAQIVAFRNTRSCLTTEPAPVVPPFFDDFPVTAIDANKWVYVDGALTSTGSINPPSPTRALQLNAVGAGLYDDDDIRTHFINMVGVTTPQLTYYVEARGVPVGKQLFVDVWVSSLRWVNVNTIVSDGVDDTAFTQYTTNLSSVSGAAHAEFRVRFRPDVDSMVQNWYVDNVYVGPPQGPATGACCLSNGTCVSATSANCATQGGNYQGDNTTCGGTSCPQPPGACCLNAGGCITTLNLALCLASQGQWQGHGTSCATAGCAEPQGACCLPNGSCVDVADAPACSALGGTFQGSGVLCEETTCPQPTGACCLASGNCIATDAGSCSTQGGTFNGTGSTCANANCPQPNGSCCLSSGVCIATDQANCVGQGGTFNGVGTTCDGANCPQPIGSCCLGDGTCVEITAAACTVQGGTFNGVGSTCATAKCPQPCPCDWNHSGTLTSQDFFDFISAFFSDNADFNMDGLTTSQDFFDFIACFFGGC